jgi:hypothetical protein
MIQLTVKELEDLLDQQKVATAEYITRNLTVYKFWEAAPTTSKKPNRN